MKAVFILLIAATVQVTAIHAQGWWGANRTQRTPTMPDGFNKVVEEGKLKEQQRKRIDACFPNLSNYRVVQGVHYSLKSEAAKCKMALLQRNSKQKSDWAPLLDVRVIQKSSDGLRVSSSTGEVFLVNLPSDEIFDGAVIGDIPAVRTGAHTYNTAAGSVRTLMKFDVGTPFDPRTKQK